MASKKIALQESLDRAATAIGDDELIAMMWAQIEIATQLRVQNLLEVSRSTSDKNLAKATYAEALELLHLA